MFGQLVVLVFEVSTLEEGIWFLDGNSSRNTGFGIFNVYDENSQMWEIHNLY